MATPLHARLAEPPRAFCPTRSTSVVAGPDRGALSERRASYSLFSLQFDDADCEVLRPYLFGRAIPRKLGDKPVTCLNLVAASGAAPRNSFP